jgi:hypothetical protein
MGHFREFRDGKQNCRDQGGMCTCVALFGDKQRDSVTLGPYAILWASMLPKCKPTTPQAGVQLATKQRKRASKKSEECLSPSSCSSSPEKKAIQVQRPCPHVPTHHRRPRGVTRESGQRTTSRGDWEKNHREGRRGVRRR